EELVHDVVTFRHPVYDLAAQLGVGALRMMNGQRQTWFAGAWMRNGFHEDGFASAVDVVEAMRRRIPASAAA
ncbi:cyclopropane-fatty-acyl-phospholipid synthase, partial [Rhodovulum sulfidophilum]|nr:cyclopropane-fatty-acyl-phospholipid synthase [Rhodovulum sulfidophilum]